MEELKNYESITWLNWQGIDWVGSTKFQLEFSNLYRDVKIVNFVSENWNYMNKNNFKLDFDIVNTNDIFSVLQHEKVVIINSFPNNKSTLAEINQFYRDLERLSLNWVKLIGFMHFNTLAYLNKCPKIMYWINLLDSIYTFNVNSDFAKEVKRFMPWKADCLRKFWLPYKLTDQWELNKEDIMVYMWRYASFKNPEKMLDLVIDWVEYQYHWCGRTIETKQRLLCHDNVAYRNIKDDNIDWKINVRWKYINKVWMDIMKKSKFAFSWFKLKAENYWNRFEYAMSEMIENQCVCVFAKHFLDNVYLNWQCLSDYWVFLWYDFWENADDIKSRLKDINEDEELRKAIVNMQLKILNQLHNPKTVVDNIVNQIKLDDVEKIHNYDLFLEKLFDWKLEDKYIDLKLCIEPADLKRKQRRQYYQRWTRTMKEDFILDNTDE